MTLYTKSNFLLTLYLFFSVSIRIVLIWSKLSRIKNKNDHSLMFLFVLDLVVTFYSFIEAFSSFSSTSFKIHFLVTISVLIENFSRCSSLLFLFQRVFSMWRLEVSWRLSSLFVRSFLRWCDDNANIECFGFCVELQFPFFFFWMSYFGNLIKYDLD
jgi:cation transport ATPase